MYCEYVYDAILITQVSHVLMIYVLINRSIYKFLRLIKGNESSFTYEEGDIS